MLKTSTKANAMNDAAARFALGVEVDEGKVELTSRCKGKYLGSETLKSDEGEASKSCQAINRISP